MYKSQNLIVRRNFFPHLSIFFITMFSSCASVPDSTSLLAEGVISKGVDMHKLNVELVKQLFEERKVQLNFFVRDKYTPSVINNYQKMIPDSTNYKKEFFNIVNSIIPIVNKKKDSLQSILDKQQQDILEKLDNDFTNYTQASLSLQNLIDSSIKIKKETNDALNAIKNLNNTTPNVNLDKK